MFFNLRISVCEYTDEYVLADTCETQREPVALDPDAGGAGGYEPPTVGCGCWELNLDSLQEQPALLPRSCCSSLYFSNC